MKKIINLIVICFLLVGVMPFVIAQETETNPGINPDNPILYGIDRALERIRMAFTFGDENKVNYGLKVAEERLAEIKAMQEKQNVKALEKAVIGYGAIIKRIENRTISEDAKVEFKRVSQKQKEILQELLLEVPEKNRLGIRDAIETNNKFGAKLK